MANEKEGGQLVLVSQTDVGMLNKVVEVWRYPSAQALLRSCDAARQVPAWQASKAIIYPLCQSLEISLLHPTASSSWQ